ncbi:hypothetical protein ACLOJK_036852 [Asimina triloba]
MAKLATMALAIEMAMQMKEQRQIPNILVQQVAGRSKGNICHEGAVPVKNLMLEQIQERKDHRNFTRGHVCKVKQIYTLLQEEEEKEAVEDNDNPLEEEQQQHGSHNFVSDRLVEKLNLLIQPTSAFSVATADDDKLACQGICKQDYSTMLDLYPLALGATDLSGDAVSSWQVYIEGHWYKQTVIKCGRCGTVRVTSSSFKTTHTHSSTGASDNNQRAARALA